MKVAILNGPKSKPDQFPIEKSVVAIGHDKEWADLSLPWDGYVSRQHARLLYEKVSYWLEDVGSRNGTFIDEKKITGKTQLKEGVEFRVGITRLRLETDDHPNPEIPFVNTISASMNVSMPSSSLKISDLESQRPIKGEAPLVSPRVKIIVLQGDYLEHTFEKSPITIGRLIENDLVLYDHRVSRQHAQLFFQGGQWHLMDLGSANDTFLNGIKLKPKTFVPLPIGATFTIARLIDLKLDYGTPEPFVEPKVAFIHTAFGYHLAVEGLLSQLSQLKRSEDKVELLKKQLALPQWVELIVIAYKLGAIQHKMRIDFVDWICEALKADDEDIRANAADVLGLIGDKRAISYLELLLSDKEKRVRARAALALGELKANQTVSKLLHLLEHDTSSGVQIAAASALMYISDQSRNELFRVLQMRDYPIKLRQFIKQFSSTKQVEGQLTTFYDSILPEV